MIKGIRSFYEDFKKLYSFNNLLKYVVISLIIIVVIDYYNLITKMISSPLWLPVGILVIILGMIYIKEIKVTGLSRVKIINDIDGVLIYALLTSLCATIMVPILEDNINYKFYLFLFLSIIVFTIINIRICYLYIKESAVIPRDFNVYDLKQLYDGTIPSLENRVLIGEEDVNYDLLERGEIINELHELIIECNPSKKIVLSLEGPWGSGKTTIINNVKKRLMDTDNIILIDEFDPWTYSNQSSMFRAMLDILLEKTEIKYRITKTKEFVDNFYNMLFDNKYTKGLKGLRLHTREEDKEIKKIKSMINDYLRITNKKIVFIVDNIDRAEPANVILLFKLVGNIFDFEHVIYLLSFDDTRVKKILKSNLDIDYEYLKKIIQIQIKVPEIQDNVKVKIIEKCIKNLMKAYGENDINKYNPIIADVSRHVLDLRDLKRFLNSVITFNYKNNRYLCYRDSIAIKIIRLYNYKLYLSIKNNEQYYISHDKEFSTAAWTRIFNKKEFNTNAQHYFKTLFEDEDNNKYQEILKEIFPYVKKYCEGKNLEEDNMIKNDKEERYTFTRDKRICSAKYFSLYFIQGKNEFLVIVERIEKFIQQINQTRIVESIDSITNTFIATVPQEWHKVLMETLECYIELIELDKILAFVKSIFNNIEYIDDSSAFFSLSGKGRAELIIADMLFKMEDRDFSSFLKFIENRYNKLYNLTRIAYWISHNRDISQEVKQIKIEEIDSVLSNMGKKVFEDRINLYEEYYYPKNIWGLYHLLKDTDRDIKFYINNILNKANVARFLWDVITLSTGTMGFRYSISKENVEIFIDNEELSNLVKEMECNSEEEKFIITVYKSFAEDRLDEWGGEGIICSEEKVLKL